MGAMPSGVRNLFRAALVIFVITVVIGILNGTDVWDPPRNTLLTHVHAGTLGWITLSIFGGAIWMFGSPGDRSSNTVATFSIWALALYVLAFWSVDLTTSSIQRPIGGTLAFVAMVWMLVWALRSHRGKTWTVAEYGMGLALFFLVIGAVLGIFLGLQLADVEIVAPENAEQLGGAHPAAMVIGYVILAGTALIEWLLRRDDTPSVSESKAGVVQMSLIFLAGVLGMLGLLLDNAALLQSNVPLEVIGLIILVWRLRRYLAPSQWGQSITGAMVRTSVLGLILGVALLAYVVSLFASGAEFEEISPWLTALDHINFIMVITNLIFAMMAMSSVVSDSANRIIYWGANIGVIGFAVGLFTESATLKRIFTPILGLALLYGIYTYLTAKEAAPAERVAA
ncbi:MAG: hypothetical protein ACRDZM_09020 [Acidimicrobiia bacterium]